MIQDGSGRDSITAMLGFIGRCSTIGEITSCKNGLTTDTTPLKKSTCKENFVIAYVFMFHLSEV